MERGSEKITIHQAIDKTHIVEPTPLMHHSMSNVESYTEKNLRAHRPSLSDCRLDPKLYFDQDIAINSLQERVVKVEPDPLFHCTSYAIRGEPPSEAGACQAIVIAVLD